tara:strand:+ start:2121 stop:2669 length:549 start_codon:yes stop_codon:yes gene_type:complete
LTKIFFIILSVVFSLIPNIAKTELIDTLKENNKLIFIRHALAPGNGDPDEFNILDCNTQRNLDSVGREQSIRLGQYFKINDIPIEAVLSSEWCRCKETAKLAFQNYETFKPLNSFYDPKFYKNKESQLINLKNFINNLKDEGNIVFVTHYVVIAAMFGVGVTSGEILIVDRNLNVLGSIEEY